MDKIYKVSELNETARQLLERNFKTIKIEGEISNLARAPSGHLYFSLKDEQASISCALFRGSRYQLHLNWDAIENGVEVCAQGKISLYAPRGQFQFIVEQIELSGLGRLEAEFQARLKRLKDQGYCDPAHKKTLPTHIMRIGVITSLSTAALQDVLTTLKRRNPLAEVYVYPSLVQGKEAPKQLIQALKIANTRDEVDVLLLVRGGGSLEDLWAFNDEELAHCIAESKLPIVSGVGHEIDFTLADFAADKRAPTPTAAAEMVSILLDECLYSFNNRLMQIIKKWKNHFSQRYYQLELLEKRLKLQSPKRQIEIQSQYFDEREQQLKRALNNYLRTLNLKLQQLIISLRSPESYIQRKREKFQQQEEKIKQQIIIKLSLEQQKINKLKEKLYNNFNYYRKRVEHYNILFVKEKQHLHRQLINLYDKKQREIKSIMLRLHALSPLQVLTRGYSIVENERGEVISNTKQLMNKEKINIYIADGKLSAQLLTIEKINFLNN